MATVGKGRAAELISQLRDIRDREIEILQELYGVRDGEKGRGPGDEDVGEGAHEHHHPAVVTFAEQGLGWAPSDPNIPMPAEWGGAWTDKLLLERIGEREGVPGCGGDQWKDIPSADPDDPAVKYIRENVLTSLRDFSFKRDPEFMATGQDSDAFYVIDHHVTGTNTLDTRGQTTTNCPLFKQRSMPVSCQREIVVKAFTPSALAAVLLSAARDSHHDYATIYAALRRHLSTHNSDRLHYDDHGFSKDAGENSPLVMMASITVPYFALSNKRPAKDQAPMSPAGVFGIEGPNQKYIREEKFTMSWTRQGWHGPSLVATFGALMHHDDTLGMRLPMAMWLTNNLRHIWFKWEEVLDYLEEQTNLPSTVIFNDELRQNLLFDDGNFTNAKKYFWALQSLRVFDDHISGTLRMLSGILNTTRSLDGSLPGKGEMEMQEKIFKGFKERIERKRLEIESLNNGLFSASSVSEARFSSEQNGNIRLLTLVTIAYLPISFAASIYGMDVLPESTTLASFFVVTAVLCTITFIITFNMQLITVFIRRHLFDKAQERMLRDQGKRWNDRGRRLRQEGHNKRKTFPASNWLYLGYFFRNVFRRTTPPAGGTV